jgi:hypothetical protein
MNRELLSNKKIAEQLQRERETLLSDESSRALLAALRQLLQSITPNLYILRWIPEQSEDLYDVLVDGTSIASIEIPRAGCGGQRTCRTYTIQEYIHDQPSMTKLERRKIRAYVDTLTKFIARKPLTPKRN